MTVVFRVVKTKNYTMMSNQHLKDKRLTLKAKGLMSVMLSLPENWDYTLRGLSAISKEGVDAISEAVKELERSGFKRQIGAGVVLTGGTALIQGCQELAEQIFNMPTRLGYPRNVGGLKDVVNNPKFATAVGLLFYGAEKEGGESRFHNTTSETNTFNSILGRMKKWFGDIK